MVGVPVLRGRGLQRSDTRGAPLVAVVNETMAARLWPGESALGKRFEAQDPRAVRNGGPDGPQTVEVVGVARDGKYRDFDDAAAPYFWTSLYQDHASTVAVAVKGHESATAMIPLLLDAIELDPGEIQLLPPTTLDSQIAIQFIHLRIASKVLGWGSTFGLFLALIGIYGVVSSAVTMRTREMAVRMAIGADRTQVVRAVVWDGLRLAIVGLGVGVLIAIPVMRIVRSVLAGVSPLDPLAFGGGLVVLGGAAFLASIIPARRATRIDPMRTLRQE
jgi:hypothetical protein